MVLSAESFDQCVEGANIRCMAQVAHFVKQVEGKRKATCLEVAVEKDIEGNEVDG